MRNVMLGAVLLLALTLGNGSTANAAPAEQVCNPPFYCVVALAGPTQISVNQTITLTGRGYRPGEPIYFFMNCESLGQVALWDGWPADGAGLLRVNLIIPAGASGVCQIGAFGLRSGVLGLRPVFVFGSGIVTLPAAPPQVMTGAVPTSAATPSASSSGAGANCVNYPSQAAAQAALRSNPADPNGLDADRDGIACENNRDPRDTVRVTR